MDAKERKKKYGITINPVACTEAWRRDMPFDHKAKGMETWSYILVNRYTKMRTHLNTYNGDTGPGHDSAKATYPIKSERDLVRALCLGKPNTYSRCMVADCPAAVVAEPPDGWQDERLIEPALDAPNPIPEPKQSKAVKQPTAQVE